MTKRLFCLLLALCVALPLLSRTETTYQRYSLSFFGAFDTVIGIIGYADGKATFDEEAGKAQRRFEQLHQLYDKYNAYGDLHNVHYLNQQASKGPVKVPAELFDMLCYGKSMHDATKGTVNIALGAVLALWHEAREAYDETNPESAALPDMEALKAAAEHVSLDDLILDEKENTVFFRDPLLQLDVGALAKGYAAELVAQELLKGPMTSFALNAGGNVRLGEPPRDGRKDWGVAVQDPDGFVLGSSESDVIDTLFLNQVSVVTSGDYQRFYVVDGVRYHHLISPETLMPPSYFRSVTIVTESSAYADLLSTAVFLMPYEEGRAYVEGLEGVEAVWVLNDRSLVMTEGLKEHARSQGASNQASP